MDRYLLDTNAASNLLRGNHPHLMNRSDGIALDRQIVPSVVRAELLFGWRSAPHFAGLIAELEIFLSGYPTLPFDDTAAEEYGKLRAYLRQSGTKIGPNDLMIAAIALANDLVLVTHNTSEFGRVPNLRLEDWQ